MKYSCGWILVGLVALAGVGCERSTSETNIVTTTTSPIAPTSFPLSGGGGSGTCQTAQCQQTCLQNPTFCGGGGAGGGGIPSQFARIPEIDIFGADNSRITKTNYGTTLRWVIPDPLAVVRIDPYPGNVGSVGSIQIFPVVTTTFTLTARNGFGVAQRNVTVFVINPPEATTTRN